MNEWLSVNMLYHALAGAGFLLLWKLLQDFEAMARRQEWTASVAILLAYGAGKENLDRELSGPALMDAASYIWLAPLAIWAWGRFGPSAACLESHFGSSLHRDYPAGLRWIPRAWTSYCHGCLRWPPRLLAGTIAPLDRAWHPENNLAPGWHRLGRPPMLYPQPVPPPGHWILCRPLYFAFTGRAGWHFRVGARYTETAEPRSNYYTIPSLALKRVRIG